VLPISLPWVMFLIGLELIGWKEQPKALAQNSVGKEELNANTIVMFPTNGVGFGHFTRLLAIAKQMKKLDESLEVIFFTTMPTLHILKQYGIPAHHISGPKYFKDMETSEWNALLEEELTLCFETHRPRMFIFDGAFPYRGMLNAIQAQDQMKKVWVRRGMLRKGASVPIDSIECFDLLVHPGEHECDESDHSAFTKPVLQSPPIVLLDPDEMMNREEARRRLSIPPDSTAVYVQLGAGQINNIQSEIRLTLDAFLGYPNVHVVLGESMIGERIHLDLPNVSILRDYPNSMYFNAFDASVQAGGYNSFHEMRNSGLPVLFYPNMDTGMDDQLTRSKIAEEEGWGIVLERRNKDTIPKACADLIDLIGSRFEANLLNGSTFLAMKILEILNIDSSEQLNSPPSHYL
jgi:UDP-N-acetylglucosamine--N-acetylmuramyl-(pentapeptide) pyrophosphoryl-undecaprenol N-acetylglucosamine transferase